MATATARGTSDACIVAWPLSFERCRTLRAVQPGHHTKLSMESGDGTTGGARLNRRSYASITFMGMRERPRPAEPPECWPETG